MPSTVSVAFASSYSTEPLYWPWVESYLKRYAACDAGDAGRGSVWIKGARGGARQQAAGEAHVFDVAERVVDRLDAGAVLLARRAAHEATDAAEAGDTEVGRHF